MTSEKDSVLYMVGGVLIGGLIGAGVAMLTAPQSGLQTRSMLKEKGVELKGKITVGAGETRDRAGKALSGLRGRAGEAIRNMRKPMPGQQETTIDLVDPMLGEEV